MTQIIGNNRLGNNWTKTFEGKIEASRINRMNASANAQCNYTV